MQYKRALEIRSDISLSFTMVASSKSFLKMAFAEVVMSFSSLLQGDKFQPHVQTGRSEPYQCHEFTLRPSLRSSTIQRGSPSPIFAIHLAMRTRCGGGGCS